MNDFKDIRAYTENDYGNANLRLWNNPQFLKVLAQISFVESPETLRTAALACKSMKDFHYNIIHPFLRKICNLTVKDLTFDGFEDLDSTTSYLYISNHRDIVMDTALLNLILFDIKYGPCETGIGDNLLIYPWIEDLVRINKNFIVKRNLSIKEQYIASKELSAYIYTTLTEKKQSIWLAQREGRSKDSSDMTQLSVIKMLNLCTNRNIPDHFSSMYLIPLSISYEYDPCDFLKAKEMQLKRDNSEYKKTRQDDLINMKTGITGYKGHVHYHAGRCINDEISTFDAAMNKNGLFEKIARILNIRIHSGYHLYANNYIAADMISGNNYYTDNYSPSERDTFSDYLKQQLNKIELPQKDDVFLRSKMLEMYANPLRNKEE